MIESILVSQASLWAVIIILCCVVMALARQVGVLHERIAPVGALSVNNRLKGGDLAPALDVKALSGEQLSIGANSLQDNERKSELLFFLSPSCPVCKTLLPILISIEQQERSWLRIILASDGETDDAHRKFVEKAKLSHFPYVVSEELGKLFGVSRLPYAVLIDESGIINALGLVNSREHLESLFETRILKVSSIQEFISNGGSSEKKVLDVA